MGIVVTALDGERVDIEVDELPSGDPQGRRQRQLPIRDANVRRLGWHVLRVPAWQAYLDPDTFACDVRRLVIGGLEALTGMVEDCPEF